jgi:hypothetical protein
MHMHINKMHSNNTAIRRRWFCATARNKTNH